VVSNEKLSPDLTDKAISSSIKRPALIEADSGEKGDIPAAISQH